MISKSTIRVKSTFGHDIYNLFLLQPPKPKSIVILFPGGDGSCDKPLLRYARKATLLSGCDVLSLEYGYYRANKSYKTEFFEQTVKEVNEAIEKCLDNSYENIYFISKSLGTAIAGEISKLIGYDKVNNLFLTPIVDTIPHIINSKCTIIVGTNDKFFPKEYINKVNIYDSVNLNIINNASHSLEIEDNYIESLEILGIVTKLCASFVCKN
ncbi:alpha/beta hydrolase [Clostridium sp. UBA6640]|uniref:alpha/beta hydrolase n=1 Tax=Clostridium sp. UBA6640 TaxID=1946370 RepID=UPI0025BC6B51|nr:alpha/beta hydrolase [Clostridium sp. UBA6640]